MLKVSDTILSLWPQAAHKENLNYSLNYLGTIFYAMRCFSTEPFFMLWDVTENQPEEKILSVLSWKSISKLP